MLTRTNATAFAVAAALVVVPCGPAFGDVDPPVQVTPGGYGLVETEVTDHGAPGSVDAAQAAQLPARTCTTTKSPNVGPVEAGDSVEWGAAPRPGPGGWLTRICSDGSIDVAWVAEAETPGAVTPERLARRATNRLRLPVGEPHFNPSRESSAGWATLVSIPTWFWVDDVPAMSQRTSVGGVWALVSASPISVTWYPGDGGGPVRCAGTGTKWGPGAPSSSCVHTYTRSSAAQPGNTYIARAVVQWRITWEGSGGLRGTLPLMQRQMEFPIAVAERQTVVTSGGGR
jgi:hypothetical protein